MKTKKEELEKRNKSNDPLDFCLMAVSYLCVFDDDTFDENPDAKPATPIALAGKQEKGKGNAKHIS